MQIARYSLAWCVLTAVCCAQPNGEVQLGPSPSALVTSDGRLFLFTPQNDSRRDQVGVLCYSTTDLETWKRHGPVIIDGVSNFRVDKANAFAIARREGRYYLFGSVTDDGMGGGYLGLAEAENPEGPYRHLTQTKLVNGRDTAVLSDDDRCWLYVGDKAYELSNDMKSIKSGPSEIKLDHDTKKFESRFLFVRNGTYYNSLAQDGNKLIYHTSDRPTGPFEFRGEITKPSGERIRYSVVEYKGRWILLFVQSPSAKAPSQTRIRAEFLHFESDGSIRLVEPTSDGATMHLALKRGRKLREECLQLMYDGDGSHETYEQALNLAEQACQLVPDHPIYLTTKAWALCRTDRTDKAYMLLEDVDKLLAQPQWDNEKTKEAVERISGEF